ALADEHEVVVVDKDAERLERLRSEADVLTYEGDGAKVETLEAARVPTADLVIGSTNDDRSNILICSTARALHEDAFTIARVTETEYLATWSQLRDAFNVDFMVGADYLTALNVVDVAGHPTAQDVEFFGDGQVEMAEYTISSGSPLANQSVRSLDLDASVNLVALCDDDQLEVVRGDTRLRPEARLLVIGRPEAIRRFGVRIAPVARNGTARHVIILGGGEIGYQTARMFEERGVEPRLVENNPERAHELAQALPNTLVLQDDATDPDFLRREGVPDADLVVAAVTPDERNLLASLLAQELGAEQVASVVHNGAYESLFTSSGIDITVNPRREVIEEILRHTRKKGVEKLTFIEHMRGEVLELELDESSALVGRPLEEAVPDVPHEFVVGAVVRNRRVVIPRGQTVLQAGDHVVVFVDVERSKEVLEVL
ncbi:MAG: Trk system potassium transporter TrkA, partial [Salinivenus sp.]